MPTPITAVIDLLLFEQRRVDPYQAGQTWIRHDQGYLVHAAANVAAGRSGTAMACGEKPLATASDRRISASLKQAAYYIDQFWFPGLGVPGSLPDPMVPSGDLDDTSDEAAAIMIGSCLLPRIIAARSIVASTDQRTIAVAAIKKVVDFATPLARCAGHAAASYHATVVADLYWRVGLVDKAYEWLSTAEHLSDGDLAAWALTTLTSGDWAAEPTGRPEVLGMSLTSRVCTVVMPARDLSTARRNYDLAGQAWAEIGSASGLATFHLRLAHLSRCERDTAGLRDHLTRAMTYAQMAGDHATVMLILLNRCMDSLKPGSGDEAVGLRTPMHDGRTIGAWARDGGSQSLVTGAITLLTALAEHYTNTGDIRHSWKAIRVAERIAAEADLPGPTSEFPEIYTPAYQKARIAFAITNLSRDLSSTPLDDHNAHGPLRRSYAWPRLSDRLSRLVEETIAAKDSTLTARLHKAMAPISQESDLGRHLQTYHTDLAIAHPWFSAREARAAGHMGRADEYFAQAMTTAHSLGDQQKECMILADMDLPHRALLLIDTLVTHTKIDPYLATRLYTHLRSSQRAEESCQRWLADGGHHPGPPWEGEALLAEVFLLTGDTEGTLEHGYRALREYENHQCVLSCDTLRTAATHNPLTARIYTTLILGHLHASELLPGTAGYPLTDTLAQHLISALSVADRARGLSPFLLGCGDDIVPISRRHDTAVAIRGWLRATSIWAGAHQRLVMGSSDDRISIKHAGQSIRHAEDDGEVAESVVERLAPAVLISRVAEPPDLVAAASRIPEDALVLAHYLTDEELISWALTRETIHLERSRLPKTTMTSMSAMVQRWMDHPEDRGDPGFLCVADAVEILLGPFTHQLRDTTRLIVVSSGVLGALPFHILPWEGTPLGITRPVSYLPAVSLLARDTMGASPDLSRGCLVVAGPGAGTSQTPQAARLEAYRVASRLGGGRPLLGPEATLTAVRTMAPSRGIVHLAGQIIASPHAPDLARIVMADNQELTSGEIMGMDLTGCVVTMSDHTARHASMTRMGTVDGLIRASLIAGASHVIVSPWPVHGETVCRVADSFYDYLVSGQKIAVALALAQQQAWQTAGSSDNRTVHPSSWAPFIHVGV